MDSLKRSRELYRKGQLDAALIAVREACAQDPDNAEAWWLLGCVARHAGLVGVSNDGFRRASELLPAQMPKPHRVTAEYFRTLIEAAKQILRDPGTQSAPVRKALATDELQALADEAKRTFQDSSLVRRWGIMVPARAVAARLDTEVIPLPSRDAIASGLSPDARFSHEADRVILYQVNHENAAGSDRDLVHVIVRSLVMADAIARRKTEQSG